MARALVLVLLVLGGQAAAGECGPRLAYGAAATLTGELRQGAQALSAYGEALSSRPEANDAHHLVQQLIVLHERLDRVAQLIEIRDGMRHAGERSLVEFKLSHEASMLKLVSSRARRGLDDFLGGRESPGEGAARLRDALGRAAALFAACDSPM